MEQLLILTVQNVGDLLSAIDDTRDLSYDCLGRSEGGILFSAQITEDVFG